jgi:hypothetical protein
MRAKCLDCGVNVAQEHLPGCGRRLELEADRILMEDRHDTCHGGARHHKGCNPCCQKHHSPEQTKLRADREIPMGLRPQQ